ncbi:hypothetical protein KXS11_15940 [Plantibacter flavus]|uniref:hypothetical protein n=1 Tax=Plantibacter flavus TaxID=150123 RepID=UPI003F156E27
MTLNATIALISRSSNSLLDRIERLARRIAVPFVRLALATVMLWFGIPKLIPNGSPAEDIAVDTVAVLTTGMITGDLARILVGSLEVVIGCALLIGRFMPLILAVMLGHMAATFAPLVIFPALTWHGPMVGSLEGQYILKNIIIIACVMILAAFDLRHHRHAKHAA